MSRAVDHVPLKSTHDVDPYHLSLPSSPSIYISLGSCFQSRLQIKPFLLHKGKDDGDLWSHSHDLRLLPRKSMMPFIFHLASISLNSQYSCDCHNSLQFNILLLFCRTSIMLVNDATVTDSMVRHSCQVKLELSYHWPL